MEQTIAGTVIPVFFY